MAQLTQSNRSAYGDINNEWTRTASLATTLGDATYLDEATGKISPASSFPDQGDEASTQRAFAAVFTGLAGSEQAVTNTTSTTAKQYKDLEIQVACDSSTFSGNDYVAPKYTAGVLSNQAFVKVTDRSRACGKVVKPYTAATTLVWVRLSSPILLGLLLDSQFPETITGQPGAAVGGAGSAVIVEGGEGADGTSGTGGAGGAVTLRGGAAGNSSSGTGGAAGTVTVGGAAGGASATGAGGAGQTVNITAGAGGAATAGVAAGGVGGVVNLVPGAGGTSFGGTAGVAGEVQVNGNGVMVTIPVTFTATDATRAICVITRPMRFKGASSAFTTASSSGTWTVEKLTSTTAPGSGTALLTGTITLAGSANTVVNGTPITTAASIAFAAGDRLGIVIAGTMTNLVGGMGSITLTPI